MSRPDPPGHGLNQEARDRERDFFDARAHALDIEAMPAREYAPFDSRFEDALLDAAAPLNGADVLELGCGIGDLTLRLLDRGARVTALDLSPTSVEVAQRRVDRFMAAAPVQFLTASAEETGLPADGFDVIVGKWVLHHLDLDRALPEIKRLLRRDGRGVFVETSGLNPLLARARRLAGRPGVASYGTPDEQPISRDDLGRMRTAFERCEVDHPNFVFFYLIDRHLIRWRWPWISRALAGADRTIERRAPALGRWSYFMRIQLSR